MKKRFMSILLILCMALTLLPTTAFAAQHPETPYAPPDGWYKIQITAGGGADFLAVNVAPNGAELSELNGINVNINFYLQNVGNNQITLRMPDGRYFGISDPIKNGTRVKAVDSPYVWNASTVTSIEALKEDPTCGYFILRLPENTDMVVNVSENKYRGGTHIILWTSKGEVPSNARFGVYDGADWSKQSVTYSDMAVLLTSLMDIMSPGLSLSRLPMAFENADVVAYEGLPASYEVDYPVGSIAYLRVWGVLPVEKFDPYREVTYGEFVGNLKKLMAYNKYRYNIGAGVAYGDNFTDDVVKKFGLRTTSASAKITMLQARLLCDAARIWEKAVYGRTEEEAAKWGGEVERGKYPYPYEYAFLDVEPSAPSQPSTPSAPAGITANPTNTKFMLNGAEVALPAYNIGGNNYVKLRDVAALLKTRFDVRWEDGKAKLYNFAAYSAVGGELAAIGTDSKSATLSTTEFMLYDKWGEWAGNVTDLTAYNIGGNNYIKLRDIVKLFDFDVDWRDGKAWIEPDVSPYTED